MLYPTSPTAQHLDRAGQYLREQLNELEASSQQPGLPLQLSGLLTALKHYEQAVLACLLPEDPVEVLSLTPEQLLAYRRTQPLYCLGWVRGHKVGLVQAQRASASALSLYAQHAALPPPTDPKALIQQVRRFLAELHLRYGAGPITAAASQPVAGTK